MLSRPLVPFHWEVEFPEVFDRAAGFDAFVGNPPFAGNGERNGSASQARSLSRLAEEQSTQGPTVIAA